MSYSNISSFLLCFKVIQTATNLLFLHKYIYSRI